jgi:outer membrane immunogenic protein
MLRKSVAVRGTPLKNECRRGRRLKPLAAVSLVALAVALSAGPVQAGGLFRDGVNDFAEFAPFIWSGLYFGGHVGFASGDVDLNVGEPAFVDFEDLAGELPGCTANGNNDDNGNGGRCGFSQDVSGVIAGAHLGFNQQFFNFVFGFEASLSGTDLDGSSMTTRTFDFDEEEPGDFDRHILGLETKTDWLGLSTLRLGYAFNRWLLYLKGGYATGNVKVRGDQEVFEFDSENETLELEKSSHIASSERHHGFHVGAGFEYAFPTTSCCNNVIFGLEYNFVDLGSERHSGIAHQFDFDEEEEQHRRFHIDVDPDGIHTIKARLSYKFGCCEAVAAIHPPLK